MRAIRLPLPCVSATKLGGDGRESPCIGGTCFGMIDAMTGNDPTFAQLRAFVIICEELHFGRAAARLHMTQPPLSRLLKRLEEAVGTQLFERTSRRVVLTPAGERFLRDARELCEGLSRAKTAARQIAQGIGVPYSFGYVESAAFDILGSVLTDFRVRRPGAQLELHELHTRDQVRMLRNHQLDMGLVRTTALGEPGLEFDEAYEDELVIALPHDHWVIGATVRLEDLANEQFIVYDRKLGSGMFNATLEATAAAGFMPIINQLATSTPMLFSLVAAGEGLALVVERTALTGRPGIRTARIVDVPARSKVVHAWREGEDNEVLQDLRALVQHHGGASLNSTS